jgi:glycerophosphoryl diester phosphodiesterase
MRTTLPILALVVALLAIAHAQPGSAGRKVLIAHRGASSYAPEHTVAAYRLAIVQQVDYVEQDLAVTKDGQLICLHDDTLERTTNVASVFPTRFAVGTGGRRGPVKQWVANDFTLAEIKQLDAGRWFHTKFADERVPTWQEAIDLVRATPGMGMYPELKSPPLYTGRGVDMVKLFVESVKKNGLDQPESLRATPIIIQSFDEGTIRRLAKDLPGIPRVLLMGSFPANGMTDARLKEIKAFANGIAPAKDLIAGQPDVVKRAHALGLTVTAYTFRSSNAGPFPNVRAEMDHFLNTLGIDAAFTDNPDQFPR